MRDIRWRQKSLTRLNHEDAGEKYVDDQDVTDVIAKG